MIAPQNAPERLKRLIERKKELDYMASSHAIAGMELPSDFEGEYMRVIAELEQTSKLIRSTQT